MRCNSAYIYFFSKMQEQIQYVQSMRISMQRFIYHHPILRLNDVQSQYMRYEAAELKYLNSSQ